MFIGQSDCRTHLVTRLAVQGMFWSVCFTTFAQKKFILIFQNYVILARDLRKEFIKGEGGCCKKKSENVKVAVENNSFVVRPGEVFGLLGPNGAGKSTTLNMIIAEEGPTNGTVSDEQFLVLTPQTVSFRAASVSGAADRSHIAVVVVIVVEGALPPKHDHMT